MSFLEQVTSLLPSRSTFTFPSSSEMTADEKKRMDALTIAAGGAASLLVLYGLVCTYGNWYFNGKAFQFNLNKSCLEKGTEYDFKGKNAWAIVSGTTINGIGYETALAFSRAGLNVILANRNSSKSEATKAAIEKTLASEGKTDTVELKIMSLDLSKQQSVCDFSKAVKEYFTENPAQSLVILCNNAAVLDMETSYIETTSNDGELYKMETQFFINYMMTTMLTEKLFDFINNSAKKFGFGRIIHVSSMAHNRASPESFQALTQDLLSSKEKDWSKHTYMKNPDRVYAYGDTKAALIMHAAQMNERVKNDGDSPLKVCSVHPGFGASQLGFNSHSSMSQRTRSIMFKLVSPMQLACEISARTQINCCLAKDDDPSVKAGAYHFDCEPHVTGRHSAAANKVITDQIQSGEFVNIAREFVAKFDVSK